MKNYFEKFSSQVKRHKVVVKNFGYLSILQLLSIVLPLITFPYLIEVLGTGLYGKVIFAQAIAMLFSNLMSYGFDISAVKTVSENRNDKTKLSKIFSSVMTLKTIFWSLSLLILILLINIVPKLNADSWLFIFSFALTFNQLLLPQWFFQGIEKMKYITMVNLVSRVSFAVLIFVFVRNESQYLYVPILNGIGAFLGGIISLRIVFSKEKIKYTIPSLQNLKESLIDGSAMFGFKIAGVIKTQTNTLLLGFLVDYTMVTNYNLAQKVSNVLTTIFTNFSAVFFPKIAKNKDINLGKKAVKLSFISSVVVYVVVAVFLKEVILWWKPELVLAANLFWIMGAFVPLYAVASFLGNSILVAHGYQILHLITTAWTTFVYLGVILYLYFTNGINVYSLAITMFISQFLSTVHKYYYCKRLKLL